MASLAVLTVAVGEVEVSLCTGIAALPGVIGLAVTAAGEVLTGAIGEVRLTVTACREGQAAVAITDQDPWQPQAQQGHCYDTESLQEPPPSDTNSFQK